MVSIATGLAYPSFGRQLIDPWSFSSRRTESVSSSSKLAMVSSEDGQKNPYPQYGFQLPVCASASSRKSS